MKSIEEVIGAELKGDDRTYYEDIYESQQINLIDALNADKNIFKNYINSANESRNIGLRKGSLDLSYNALRSLIKDSKGIYAYGSTIGVDVRSQALLNGMNFSDIESIDYSLLPDDIFGWPVPANMSVSAIYGYSNWYEDDHGGIDIWAASKNGEPSAGWAYLGQIPVYAAHDGVVTEVYNACSDNLDVEDPCGDWYGNHVYLLDSNTGYMTIYAHLYEGSVQVKTGQEIKRGDAIGYMGTSGPSSGIHLHFEVRLPAAEGKNPNKISSHEKSDPLLYFNTYKEDKGPYSVEPNRYNVEYEKKIRKNITMSNPYKVVYHEDWNSTTSSSSTKELL